MQSWFLGGVFKHNLWIFQTCPAPHSCCVSLLHAQCNLPSQLKLVMVTVAPAAASKHQSKIKAHRAQMRPKPPTDLTLIVRSYYRHTRLFSSEIKWRAPGFGTVPVCVNTTLDMEFTSYLAPKLDCNQLGNFKLISPSRCCLKCCISVERLSLGRRQSVCVSLCVCVCVCVREWKWTFETNQQVFVSWVVLG